MCEVPYNTSYILMIIFILDFLGKSPQMDFLGKSPQKSMCDSKKPVGNLKKPVGDSKKPLKEACVFFLIFIC